MRQFMEHSSNMPVGVNKPVVSSAKCAEDIDSSQLEGVLCKYTNAFKGWQYRWFFYNQSSGVLEYYEKEDQRAQLQKPRGAIPLAGAIVAPSDEDSQTFTVVTTSQTYRLRANDSKERHYWISQLKSIVQSCPKPRFGGSGLLHVGTDSEGDPGTPRLQHSQRRKPRKVPKDPSATYLLEESQRQLDNVSEVLGELQRDVAKVPSYNKQFSLLMLKAVAEATRNSLEKCQGQLQQNRPKHGKQRKNKPYAVPVLPLKVERDNEPLDTAEIDSVYNEPELLPLGAECGVAETELQIVYSEVRQCDEVRDEELIRETGVGPVEEGKKAIILHLLSQLKIGMDLTRVTLPTFILERRSLLEMFADCMGHPDMFLDIAEAASPRDRVICLLKWYLLSFHASGRNVAKKPYNPIIGETFHCSWEVTRGGQTYTLSYLAEQVSHHPPVSAFHFSCPEKGLHMTGSIYTKSKFMGLSAGVNLVGQISLHLADEIYVFTLPSAFARSILTYPWVELGDRCTIACPTTGYSAAVVFHTKPFYGGEVHQVSAEVRSPEPGQELLLEVTGQWNGQLTFRHLQENRTRVIDTSTLDVERKRVRPLHLQGNFESRNLWRHVTDALSRGDIADATHHKHQLEEMQRAAERRRAELGLRFPTRFFQRTGQIHEWQLL